jgi:MoaA/NifB/PqqE/SkfB family radical SAM enzyme
MGWRDPVLRGIVAGRPEVGPVSVHLDVTNSCNAACGTCWDHSPWLTQPRSAAWKRRRLPMARFEAITDALAAMGSVRHVVLSGMGEPLTHPDIYAMIARTKAIGWDTTVITNLVAADAEALAGSGVDQLLVGVQGVTPATHAAFHPGWNEAQFFAMVAVLRRLMATNTRVRHVQVIDTHTAPELVEMVRFAYRFRADRVNFKLASLRDGTEVVGATAAQRLWMSE